MIPLVADNALVPLDLTIYWIRHNNNSLSPFLSNVNRTLVAWGVVERAKKGGIKSAMVVGGLPSPSP
ncbi:hypothetical protein ES703_108551 [subsurface metagenome]